MPRKKQSVNHILVVVTVCSTLLWLIHGTTQGFTNIGPYLHALFYRVATPQAEIR